MGLDTYWIGLIVLVPCVALVSGRNIVFRPFRKTLAEKEPELQKETEARKFRRVFLQVYLIVMGSEWLQVSLYPCFCHNFANQMHIDVPGSIHVLPLPRRETHL
jgi:hypothetical protein